MHLILIAPSWISWSTRICLRQDGNDWLADPAASRSRAVLPEVGILK
jgi:hypothetical protein